jgi:PPM family protein phosphatase
VSARRREESWAAATDVGRVRPDNEDAYVAVPPLFAVADGLGGHRAGEVASKLAIETLTAHAPETADEVALGQAVQAANEAVVSSASDSTGRTGMGTTLTAVVIEGTSIAIAHVGDSRAYLLTADGLSQLTEDHSMVGDLVRAGQLSPSEARFHPNRNVITRALGTDPEMHADEMRVEASPGDRLLLCTDGLHGVVPEREIAEILITAETPAAAARALVDAALGLGGPDNVTAVVVDIADGADAADGPGRLRRWLGSLGLTLGGLAVLAALATLVVR